MRVNMDVVRDAESRIPAPNGAPAVRGQAELRAATAKGSIFNELLADTVLRAQARVTHLSFGGTTPSRTELERTLGTNDLVDEFYLSRALAAAKPVVHISTPDGEATGFMVSPSLLLTNWHVFNTAEDAQRSSIRFDFTHAISGQPLPGVEFGLDPNRFFYSNPDLDHALVAVAAASLDGSRSLASYGYHRLVADPSKIREGEFITIIQHPGGQRRQYAIRENELLTCEDAFLTYKSDTAPGSSGAPAFNDSFQVVALHRSGRAQRDGGLYVLKGGRRVKSLDNVDDSEVVWTANEGVRISTLCSHLRAALNPTHPLVSELLNSMDSQDDVISSTVRESTPERQHARLTPARTSSSQHHGIVVPVTIEVSIATAGHTVAAREQPIATAMAAPASIAQLSPATEKAVEPVIDTDYDSRTGYDTSFLGIEVPLPTPKDPSSVSKLDDGSHVLRYEHFSIVMHRERRLALFCASNVNGDPDTRKPPPGRKYTRSSLTGIGKNDREAWVTDPRIPEQHQLPDRFYNKDRKAFDKGHLVRREDMAWGADFEEVRRANNDTYHTTNCSPQVSGFNQAGEDGIWGQLENEILKQAKSGAQRYTLFTGPILENDDREFEGFDDRGEVTVQIPRRFWKVIVTTDGNKLQAYGFVLEQRLSGVKFSETFDPGDWRSSLIPLNDLEAELMLTFPKNVVKADQFTSAGAVELMQRTKITLKTKPQGDPQDSDDKRPRSPDRP